MKAPRTSEQQTVTEPKIPQLPVLHWHTVVVLNHLLDASSSIALVLGSPNDAPLPRLAPGQFVWVAVTTPHPELRADPDERNILKYSLWTAPRPGHWQLTLLLAEGLNAEFAGNASDYLHYHICNGDRLDVGVPAYPPLTQD
jgi:ferredoxin-NADP reductase